MSDRSNGLGGYSYWRKVYRGINKSFASEDQTLIDGVMFKSYSYFRNGSMEGHKRRLLAYRRIFRANGQSETSSVTFMQTLLWVAFGVYIHPSREVGGATSDTYIKMIAKEIERLAQ